MGVEHESGRRDSKILDFSEDSHLGISVKVRSFLGCLSNMYCSGVYMIMYVHVTMYVIIMIMTHTRIYYINYKLM